MTWYVLRVRKKSKLVKAMVEALCGGAQLSLEGDLSQVQGEISAIRGAANGETRVLHRHTLAPQVDFVILPLEPETKESVIRRVVDRVGVVRNVFHIQIAKHGELEFAAYDNFSPDCVGVGSAISEETLQSLVDSGVLWGYQPHERNQGREHHEPSQPSE